MESRRSFLEHIERMYLHCCSSTRSQAYRNALDILDNHMLRDAPSTLLTGSKRMCSGIQRIVEDASSEIRHVTVGYIVPTMKDCTDKLEDLASAEIDLTTDVPIQARTILT